MPLERIGGLNPVAGTSGHNLVFEQGVIPGDYPADTISRRAALPYQTIWEKGGIYVVYSGQTSDQEVARLAREGQADERFMDIRYVLHDFLNCSGATFSTPRMRELSAIDAAAAASNPRIKIAVVTDREDVLEMVIAYLDAGFPGFELRLFATLPAARAWLQGNSAA